MSRYNKFYVTHTQVKCVIQTYLKINHSMYEYKLTLMGPQELVQSGGAI